MEMSTSGTRNSIKMPTSCAQNSMAMPTSETQNSKIMRTSFSLSSTALRASCSRNSTDLPTFGARNSTAMPDSLMIDFIEIPTLAMWCSIKMPVSHGKPKKIKCKRLAIHLHQMTFSGRACSQKYLQALAREPSSGYYRSFHKRHLQLQLPYPSDAHPSK